MSNQSLSPLMQPRPAQALEWFVIVETGTLAGRRFPIGSTGPLTLGRDPSCTLRFDPNQERMVGRRHAYIELRNDGVYLVDDSSANGTFKDGQAIHEVRLQHGDRFQLGGEVEGVQGPWVSIHIPVAVHVTPMRAETATLVTRPSPATQPTVPSIPAAPAVSSSSTAPSIPSIPTEPPGASYAPPASVSPPPAASRLNTPVRESPMTPLHAEPESQVPASSRYEKYEALAAAVVAEPQLSQRRSQLVRQVAAIVLLCILACTIGVLLGARQGADPDSESAAQLQD